MSQADSLSRVVVRLTVTVLAIAICGILLWKLAQVALVAFAAVIVAVLLRSLADPLYQRQDRAPAHERGHGAGWNLRRRDPGRPELDLAQQRVLPSHRRAETVDFTKTVLDYVLALPAFA